MMASVNIIYIAFAEARGLTGMPHFRLCFFLLRYLILLLLNNYSATGFRRRYFSGMAPHFARDGLGALTLMYDAEAVLRYSHA